MPDQTPVEPEFKITIDEEYTIVLGRCSVIWSQIDFLLGLAIALSTGVSHAMIEAFLGEALTGRRVKVFQDVSARLTDPALRSSAEKICKRLRKLADRRNRIVHGLWGRYVAADGKETPAVYYKQNPQNPVHASELRTIAIKFAAERRSLGDFIRAIDSNALPPTTHTRVVKFGPGASKVRSK